MKHKKNADILLFLLSLQVQLYELRGQIRELRFQIHELQKSNSRAGVQIYELRVHIHDFKNYLINENSSKQL